MRAHRRYAGRFETEAWGDTEDIYGEGVIQELLDDDELSREEEAFMRGYRDVGREHDLEDYY